MKEHLMVLDPPTEHYVAYIKKYAIGDVILKEGQPTSTGDQFTIVEWDGPTIHEIIEKEASLNPEDVIHSIF